MSNKEIKEIIIKISNKIEKFSIIKLEELKDILLKFKSINKNLFVLEKNDLKNKILKILKNIGNIKKDNKIIYQQYEINNFVENIYFIELFINQLNKILLSKNTQVKNFTDLIKNNNVELTISIYAPNGTGKSLLNKKLNELFCRKEIKQLSQQNLSKMCEFQSDSSPTIAYSSEINNETLYESLYLNELTYSKNGIILPENLLFFMNESSFSNSLRYEQVCDSAKEIDEPHLSIRENYKILENSLPAVNSIELNQSLKNYPIYCLNSTDIEIYSGHIIGNKIEKVALIIELIASLIKISISEFLRLIKYMSENLVNKYLNEKLKELYNNKINFYEMQNFIEILFIQNFKYLNENLKLLNFLILFNEFNIKNKYNIIYEIQKYNNNILNNFDKAKETLNIFFPNKFEKIHLEQRYNSSLGIEVYDIKITNYGNEFSTFNFLGNIGSEGEKKLINMIHLIINLSCLENNKKYLITSDDAFDSFDHSNFTNIFWLLKSLIDKNNKFTFINFTHSYEQFRQFNKIFELEREETYLMSKPNNYLFEKNVIEDFIFTKFPIKNNFYKDYLIGKNHYSLKDKMITIVATIPYYRNIIEIIEDEGEGSNKYCFATSLLHKKEEAINYLINMLDDIIFKNYSFKEEVKEDLKNYASYYNLLQNLYDYFKIDLINKNLIEYRIFLSIYGRFLIEDTIIILCKPDLSEIKSNQTRELINQLEKLVTDEDIEKLKKDINYLYSYIPSYIHTEYNEIAYLIGLDINNLIKGIEDLLISKKLLGI